MHWLFIIPEKSELKSEAFGQASNGISDVQTYKSVEKSVYGKNNRLVDESEFYILSPTEAVTGGGSGDRGLHNFRDEGCPQVATEAFTTFVTKATRNEGLVGCKEAAKVVNLQKVSSKLQSLDKINWVAGPTKVAMKVSMKVATKVVKPQKVGVKSTQSIIAASEPVTTSPGFDTVPSTTPILLRHIDGRKEEVTSLSRFGKALLLTNRSRETFAEQAPLRTPSRIQDSEPASGPHPKLRACAGADPFSHLRRSGMGLPASHPTTASGTSNPRVGLHLHSHFQTCATSSRYPVVLGALYLLPDSRYILLALASASVVVNIANAQLPTQKLERTKQAINACKELVEGIKLTCPRDHVELTERSGRLSEVEESASRIRVRLLEKSLDFTTWKGCVEYVKDMHDIRKKIHQCAKDVKEIETSTLVTIEAEIQRKSGENIRDCDEICDALGSQSSARRRRCLGQALGAGNTTRIVRDIGVCMSSNGSFEVFVDPDVFTPLRACFVPCSVASSPRNSSSHWKECERKCVPDGILACKKAIRSGIGRSENGTSSLRITCCALEATKAGAGIQTMG
ncbi:hypothetical protein B0H14DRAFT_3673998 [Mycena olivaceomarginata]|nr:hypothetical protein B0H14DRAFT_3673998 [Mycena olivaceomarginata]